MIVTCCCDTALLAIVKIQCATAYVSIQWIHVQIKVQVYVVRHVYDVSGYFHCILCLQSVFHVFVYGNALYVRTVPFHTMAQANVN